MVHQRLLALAARKHAYDVEEGEWLILGQSMRVHEMFGYSSFIEYLERVFGYTPKMAVERLRVARALAELPKTRTAVAEGAISWSTARELTRVVNTETEGRWLAAAKGKTVREMERMVAFRKPGDDPDSPPSPVPERRVARFDLGADAWALLQEARARVARDLGHHVTDDELIRTMARAVLDGPNDEGRSSYSIHVTKCDACGVANQRAGGEDVIVGPEVVEMAECDAIILPSGPPHGDDPEESRAFATAFLVLVRLGYKEGQARRGIEGVRPHVGPDAETNTIIRAALAWLREQASQARDADGLERKADRLRRRLVRGWWPALGRLGACQHARQR